MASITWKTLRLFGINVANGVVFGLLRKGSGKADGQTPTNYLSLSRHPFPYPTPGMDTETRYERSLSKAAAHTAKRAGRFGCLAGVLRSCAGPVQRTGRTFQSWTSRMRRELQAMAWFVTGWLPGVQTAIVGNVLAVSALQLAQPSLQPLGWQGGRQGQWKILAISPTTR